MERGFISKVVIWLFGRLIYNKLKVIINHVNVQYPKKSEVIVEKDWALLTPGPIISKESGEKRKKKAVVN